MLHFNLVNSLDFFLVFGVSAWFCGMVAGWSLFRYESVIINVLYLYIAKELSLTTVVGSTTLFVFVAFWLIMGIFTGVKARSYIGVVGWDGYLFTLCSSTIGVGLGALVYEFIAFIFCFIFGIDKKIDPFGYF